MTLVEQAGIVIGVTVLSVALLWAARRSPFNERFASEVGEHNKAFDFLGTAFAVLLAFVVLEAYDSYNEGKRGAELEAQAVLELSRTAEAYRAGGERAAEGHAGLLRPGGRPSRLARDAGRELEPGRQRVGQPVQGSRSWA